MSVLVARGALHPFKRRQQREILFEPASAMLVGCRESRYRLPMINGRCAQHSGRSSRARERVKSTERSCFALAAADLRPEISSLHSEFLRLGD
jgi:hypothetical protein